MLHTEKYHSFSAFHKKSVTSLPPALEGASLESYASCLPLRANYEH
jgi:hypothetical protein